MSARGTSTRERRIDAIIDHIREPAFRCYEVPGAIFIVEESITRTKAPYVGEKTSMTDTFYREKFSDKKLALFVRDRKNAEALMNAIERIGSDKRQR